MKKALFYVMLIFSPCLSKSQDLFSIRLSGFGADYSQHIYPKTIVLDGTDRLIVYERKGSNPGGDQHNIGVTKINASNQIIFDTRIDITEPGLYVAGAELLGHDLYILFGTNTNRVFTWRVDSDGYADGNPNVITVSGVSTFTPTDLFMGTWIHDYHSGNYSGSTAILGYSGSKIIMLYSDPYTSIYHRRTFDAPGISSYENLKFNSFWIIDGADANSIEISGKANPMSGGFSFQFNPYQNQVMNAYNYNINNADFEFFKRMSFDGFGIFYGQLKGGDITNQNGDIFFIFETDAVQAHRMITFSNPYFHAVTGDAHSKENTAYNVWETFSGYYFDPSDPRNPYYALGLIDVRSQFNVTANTYGLKTPYVPGTPLVKQIGATTCDWQTGSRTAVLDRHTDATDPLTLYYLKNTVNTGSCNGTIDFTQTFNNVYSASAFNITQLSSDPVYVDGGISPYSSYYLYGSHSIDAACTEKTTNSVLDPFPGDGGFWDPICGCYTFTPGGNQTKKSSVGRTTYEETSHVDFSIFPNPILNNNNTITCRSTSIIKNIIVSDASGKSIAIKNNILSKQTTVLLPKISAGTYFVKMTTIDGKQKTAKVIKL